MKSRTFRLSENDIELLKQLSESRGESQSDTLRFAIHQLNDAIHESSAKDNKEDKRNADSRTFEILLSQLEVKDKQIESLISQNSELQRLVDQEQKLHLASKVDSPKLIEEKEKKSFWKRVFG